MILELAKIRGFSVIAVVRRQEQVASIKALGASEVICSANEDITKRTLALTKLQGRRRSHRCRRWRSVLTLFSISS
jgi:NADPH:quinone reductase-like Zn-dependent oxidoreductase